MRGGSRTWCDLRRRQRFVQHRLEAEQQKLAQFEVFVRLIEQGCSKYEACEQIYDQAQCPPEQDAAPEADSALESQLETPLLSASDTEQTPASELEPKSLAGRPVRLSCWRSSGGSQGT